MQWLAAGQVQEEAMLTRPRLRPAPNPCGASDRVKHKSHGGGGGGGAHPEELLLERLTSHRTVCPLRGSFPEPGEPARTSKSASRPAHSQRDRAKGLGSWSGLEDNLALLSSDEHRHPAWHAHCLELVSFGSGHTWRGGPWQRQVIQPKRDKCSAQRCRRKSSKYQGGIVI